MIRKNKTKIKIKTKIKKSKDKNPRFIQSPLFDTEEDFEEQIEREIRAKSRINIESLDGKFHIIGIIKKKQNNYIVEIEDKYGITASVAFKAKDILKTDYESATITLK